jgi:hypothetical protein
MWAVSSERENEITFYVFTDFVLFDMTAFGMIYSLNEAIHNQTLVFEVLYSATFPYGPDSSIMLVGAISSLSSIGGVSDPAFVAVSMFLESPMNLLVAVAILPHQSGLEKLHVIKVERNSVVVVESVLIHCRVVFPRFGIQPSYRISPSSRVHIPSSL